MSPSAPGLPIDMALRRPEESARPARLGRPGAVMIQMQSPRDGESQGPCAVGATGRFLSGNDDPSQCGDQPVFRDENPYASYSASLRESIAQAGICF